MSVPATFINLFSYFSRLVNISFQFKNFQLCHGSKLICTQLLETEFELSGFHSFLWLRFTVTLLLGCWPEAVAVDFCQPHSLSRNSVYSAPCVYCVAMSWSRLHKAFWLVQDRLVVCNHIPGQGASMLCSGTQLRAGTYIRGIPGQGTSVLCTGPQLRAGTDIYLRYPGLRSICAPYWYSAKS